MYHLISIGIFTILHLSFNEVELTASDTASEPEISKLTIASYRRRKTVGKRDVDLDGLPARVIDHQLPDEELTRLFPHGYKKLPDEIYCRLHIIHADETPVKVMRINNNKIKNRKKTHMWIYRNRPTEKDRPIVLFDWQLSRKADHPRDFLKNFSGTVITDGYQVYHKLGRERDDLTICGCWIHARRPFTIGRKNFVLIETSNGACASAMIYSIVETAKVNYLNAYQYFELLLTRFQSTRMTQI